MEAVWISGIGCAKRHWCLLQFGFVIFLRRPSEVTEPEQSVLFGPKGVNTSGQKSAEATAIENQSHKNDRQNSDSGADAWSITGCIALLILPSKEECCNSRAVAGCGSRAVSGSVA